MVKIGEVSKLASLRSEITKIKSDSRLTWEQKRDIIFKSHEFSKMFRECKITTTTLPDSSDKGEIEALIAQLTNKIEYFNSLTF